MALIDLDHLTDLMCATHLDGESQVQEMSGREQQDTADRNRQDWHWRCFLPGHFDCFDSGRV